MVPSEVLEVVERRVAARRGELQARWEALGPEVPGDPGDWSEAVFRHRRVTVNFHPDRLDSDGRTVARALREEGVYRSQFETGLSNGGLTARPGGDRDLWEERLFEGYYQRLEGERTRSSAMLRPRYGGLNLLGFSGGACPRFGSCFLRLRPGVARRGTFSLGDSVTAPEDLGTQAAFLAVLVGLLEQLRHEGALFGAGPMSPGQLLNALSGDPWRDPDWALRRGRSLDGYVEVQIHGGLAIREDVEALVADGSFRGSPVGEDLEALARDCGLELRWLPALTLQAADVPRDFRGPRVAELAKILSDAYGSQGQIDAATIGRGARSMVLDPSRWHSRGPPEVLLQEVKQLWHVLAAHGNPPRNRERLGTHR